MKKGTTFRCLLLIGAMFGITLLAACTPKNGPATELPVIDATDAPSSVAPPASASTPVTPVATKPKILPGKAVLPEDVLGGGPVAPEIFPDDPLLEKLPPLPTMEEALDYKGNSGPKETAEKMALRPKAIKETAIRYGVQLGFAHRYRDIQGACYEQRQVLDRLFPFRLVMIEGGKVVPPVIVNAESYLELVDPVNLKSTRSSWRILRPARFATVPPNWRDYYVLPPDALSVEKPYAVMLPRNGEERDMWRGGLREGYVQGYEFADRHFENANAKLMQEFTGLVQYHLLSRQGMITMPDVKAGHYAIRVGADTLELDQETFTITDPSKFQDKKHWRALP